MTARLTQCAHCRRAFEVDERFAGGLVTCPGCGKVAEVGGLRDPLWTALRIGIVVVAVGIGIGVGGAAGVVVGVLGGIGAWVGLWLLSRAC